MTNRIAFIFALSFSFLFGVDTPKEIETLFQTATSIQFDAEAFQQNQLIKKRLQESYKQARKSKSIPKPAGSPIYISNQKSGNTLKKETPAKKVLGNEVHLEKRENAKQKLNELRAQAKAGNIPVIHDAMRKIKFDRQTSTRSRSRSTGTEFEFETIAELYVAFGDVLATEGSGCDGCPGNLDEMEVETSFPIFRQDSFEAWASESNFLSIYFQFIDENESGEYDDGEIYAVSCEDSEISNNKTVAYNGSVYDLDFVVFWMEAYDFDWNNDDENDDFEFLGELNGHEYYVSNFESTWNDANNMFNEYYEEVHLVTISSQDENDFVFLHTGGDVWIGFTDQYEEGNWEWVTGEDVVYTNWAGGEPNNMNGEEHWAQMLNNGSWNDFQNDSLHFVVEVVDDTTGGDYFIEGIVRDFNGDPIAGVELNAENQIEAPGATTDEGGYYHIDLDSPGLYRVDVWPIDGYWDDLTMVEVWEGGTQYDFMLGHTEETALLEISSTVEDNGDYVPFAELWSPQSPQGMSVADWNGMDLITIEIPIDFAEVFGGHPEFGNGYGSTDVNTEINPGEAYFVDVIFGDDTTGGDDGWIEGHVWDQDGNGIEDAWVSAWGNSGDWSTNTGPDGYYSLTEMPPGEYEMTASADGFFDSNSGGIEVFQNEGTYNDFYLEQEDQGSGTIHATVYDHEGNPNDSAEVIFFSYENTVVIGVDGNGVASAELSPGPWSVFASDSDTSTWFDIWDGGVTHVEDGSTDNVELFFYPVEEYGYVSIFVRMETNGYSEPIVEAPVVIEDSEGNIHFEGYTHVNGGIGEALLPGDDYLARVETEYGYQEQYFSVFENSFNFVEVVFGGEPPDPALFGTWMMAPEANAVMAGPNPFDGSYFSNTEEDVDTFWCYYDDLYVFDEDGFHNDHDDQTWVEVWQGADQEGCGFPVYPHDGSSNPAGYDFGGGTLTLHGIGAYIGLPRAANGFELTSPDQAPESITYEVSFSYDGEIMYLVIEAGAGLFWTFKLIREDDEGDFTFLGEFDGSEYYLSDYADTWTNANDMLQSWGIPEIHLVTVGSQEENDFLVDVYNEDEFWIGFTDQDEEGNWQWVTGEEVVYTNWFDGEPNNSEGIQHYGISNFAEAGFWDDSENDIWRRFIVEVEETSESATILDVSDVPDDQGGRVYVKFSRSVHDTDPLRDVEMYTVERLDGDTWVGLNSVSAYGNDEYVVEATTLADSTSENDAIMTYRIIAAMEEGNFASEPESGYSVDNIAPGAPTGVVAGISDGVVYLEWAPSDANDLDYYAVYRSTDPEFLPGEENMIGSSEGSDFADDVEELGDYYYAVTAFDIHENESDPSELVNVTLLSLEDIHGLPEVFTLHQNYPNPFNPNTQIQYALPTDANVSIVIYDLMGRQIRTLVNQQISAGYHSVMWNATSEMGSPVSAGVYIYTITANDFRDVKKMILLK